MPTSRSFISGGKNSIIIHCRTRSQLSEDRGISESSFLFASSCSAEKCTNGCHLQVVTTCSEIFYGDLIKRSPSIKTLSVFWSFFFDEVLAARFNAILTHLALSAFMQSCRNISFAFLWWKGTDRKRLRSRAIKSSLPVKKILLRAAKFSDCRLSFVFLHLALIWHLLWARAQS